MDHCCEGKTAALEKLREHQGRTLKIVLAINLVMFGVEAISGWVAESTALLADSLDMLGDALAYAFTLYVLGRSLRWRATAALSKGILMAASGAVVLVQVVSKVVSQRVPDSEAMGIVAMLALAANVACLGLLLRHRKDDINLQSAWICSRNDILANLAVVGAAALVAATGSYWPDVAIGLGVALLFLHSAHRVCRDALAELRTAPA